MANNIPDIAMTEPAWGSCKLDRVGMSAIGVPIRIESQELGIMTSIGLADAYVSLDDPDSKGIHMSRLYLSLSVTWKSTLCSSTFAVMPVFTFMSQVISRV